MSEEELYDDDLKILESLTPEERMELLFTGSVMKRYKFNPQNFKGFYGSHGENEDESNTLERKDE